MTPLRSKTLQLEGVPLTTRRAPLTTRDVDLTRDQLEMCVCLCVWTGVPSVIIIGKAIVRTSACPHGGERCSPRLPGGGKNRENHFLSTIRSARSGLLQFKE